MEIMTYDKILQLKEWNGVPITDKIRQKAIETTEKLDLLSYSEGLDIVLDDMEILVNEEAEKSNKVALQVQKEIMRTEGKKEEKEKKPRKPRTPKVDKNKDDLLNQIMEFAESCQLMTNPQFVKKGQLSFVDKEGNYYSLKLTKHKTKPEGYEE